MQERPGWPCSSDGLSVIDPKSPQVTPIALTLVLATQEVSPALTLFLAPQVKSLVNDSCFCDTVDPAWVVFWCWPLSCSLSCVDPYAFTSAHHSCIDFCSWHHWLLWTWLLFWLWWRLLLHSVPVLEPKVAFLAMIPIFLTSVAFSWNDPCSWSHSAFLGMTQRVALLIELYSYSLLGPLSLISVVSAQDVSLRLHWPCMDLFPCT